MSGLQSWGLDVVLWFQSWRSLPLEWLGLALHYAGGEIGYFFILPTVYWALDKELGKRIGIMLTLAGWVNSTLKAVLKAPRPYQLSSEVKNLAPGDYYGNPSGHAQFSAVVGGVIALQLRRRWVVWAVVIYSLLSGISRMMIGVHSPQDVITGWLVGLIMLGVYVIAEPRVTAWMQKAGMPAQFAAVIGLFALMMIIHPGIIPATSAPWLAEPLTRDGLIRWAVTPAATFLGLGIGLIIEERAVRFSTRGSAIQRILRLLLGIVVLIAIWQGLDIAFDGLEPPFIFRTIRYTAVGLWSALGGPWLFVTIGLAGREDSEDSAA